MEVLGVIAALARELFFQRCHALCESDGWDLAEQDNADSEAHDKERFKARKAHLPSQY